MKSIDFLELDRQNAIAQIMASRKPIPMPKANDISEILRKTFTKPELSNIDVRAVYYAYITQLEISNDSRQVEIDAKITEIKISLGELLSINEIAKLFDCYLIRQLSEKLGGNCVITKDYIRFKSITEQIINRAGYTLEQAELIGESANEIKLNFPCSISEFIGFMNDNGLIDYLPISLAEMVYHYDIKKAKQLSIDEIKAIEFDINNSTANIEGNPKGNNERISTREEGKHRFDNAIYDFDNYDTPIMPVQNQEVHLKPLLDLISKGLDRYLDHFIIAELWASVRGNNSDIAEYRNLIGDAVIKRDLKAIVETRKHGYDDGYKEIENYNRVRKIDNGWLREDGKEAHVQYVIERDDFKSWLESTNRYPLDNGCLLNEWFLGIEQSSAGNITKSQAEDTANNSAGSGERELTRWLRETWISEGMKGGTEFFNALKKHKNEKGSPIIDHYTAGENAGIKWRSSAGNTGELAKKTILTKVSTFKKTAQQNTVNSKK